MSLNESSATALVRFTGLGIICFNKDRQRGEIAAIRDTKHAMTIRIQKPMFQEGTGNDTVAYQDIATYQKLPREDVQIEIRAAGQPAIAGYEFYKPSSFDRLNGSDVNDIRWLVNISQFHPDNSLSPTANQSHPLSKIYIDNGLFYTAKLDTNLFFEKVAKDSNGMATQREAFGNVGETLGVKIEAEEVQVTIRIAGQEETHSLKRIDGLPFRIEIRNTNDTDNAVYSDMPDYYGYLASPSGAQFDLEPVLEDTATADGGSVNQIEFCHPIITDNVDSIDDLH